jgi:hypothetical protein
MPSKISRLGFELGVFSHQLENVNLATMKLLMQSLFVALVIPSIFNAKFSIANAQGTAFTYNGKLNDRGNAANGSYDLCFTLYDAVTDGDVIGSVTNTATRVSKGLFIATLDFGNVFDGSDYWLEIAVRKNGYGAFSILSPRQPITPTPYAIYSAKAGSAATAQVANSASSVSAQNITGTIDPSQLSSEVVTNGASGVTINGFFSGNGTGVTNISVNSLFMISNSIIAWGDNSAGETTIPAGLNNVIAIAAGSYFSLAVKSDGTVVGWGDNFYSETTIPSGLSNVVAVAAGSYFSLALKNDGTVTAWGRNSNFQTSVPSGLNSVIAVSAGSAHCLALKSNGTVTAWGDNTFGETTVPSGLNNVVAVAAGEYFSLALKSDGTVVEWGFNSVGQTNVPSGLNNVVAVAVGAGHSLALKTNGTVVAWGFNNDGQANVPTGLTNVIAVAAGFYHSLALKNDGTVVAWGDTTAPAGLTNVLALASGCQAGHVLVIQKQIVSSVALLIGGLTTNLVVNVPTGTKTLFFTNGVLRAVQ